MNILSSLQVKTEAARLGFSACGLAPAAPLPKERAAALHRWLAAGMHGEMGYLERHASLRLDPTLLVPGARTVVSVALNYYPAATPPEGGFRLARYALGLDYHDVVRQRLRALLAAIGAESDGRPCCDTAPVDEHYWAVRCGLGWQGRNGQLIIPGAGSYFFLGELLLTLPADRYDEPSAPRCGTCSRCVKACPGGALNGDGTMDARRCLSYLTIEQRGPLPSGTGRLMGRCFYGCDRCSETCPWNRFARPTDVEAFAPRPGLLDMTDEAWLRLSPEEYHTLFKGSAVKRAKYEGLMRNIREAAGL